MNRKQLILRLGIVATLIYSAVALEKDRAAKINNGRYFKSNYFLPDEDQSCPDISDIRSKNKDNWIKFCLLPVPKAGQETVLSFWGWDQRFGSEKGRVQLYSETLDANETLILDIPVPPDRSGNDIKFYYNEFSIVDTTNLKRLKLYYLVGSGGSKQLHLRDVWVRPKKTNDDSDPSFRCSDGGFVVGAIICAISSVGCLYIVFKSIGCGATKISTFMLKSWFVFFTCTLIASSVLIVFSDGYPNMRCKNDDAFAGAIATFCFGALLLIFMYVHVKFKIRILPYNDQPLNVIKAATENEARKRKAGTNKLANATEIDHFADTECCVCKKRFSLQRPAILTKCGHVWCKDCVVEECQLLPPNYRGLCGACGCMVTKYDITVLELKQTPTVPLVFPISPSASSSTQKSGSENPKVTHLDVA